MNYWWDGNPDLPRVPLGPLTCETHIAVSQALARRRKPRSRRAGVTDTRTAEAR